MIEADFQRFYGIDLAHLLWVDRVGVRRLWDLIAGLPPESGFQRALQSKPPRVAAPAPGHGGWRSLARRMGIGR